jgi:hypothetical protein
MSPGYKKQRQKAIDKKRKQLEKAKPVNYPKNKRWKIWRWLFR